MEAPIGFGKTTAVRNFLNSKKNPPIWITLLNTEVSSSSHFWRNFTSQLSKLDERVANKLNALGYPVDTPQMEMILSMLNSIVFPAKTVLVIDDYHILQDMNIHHFLMHIVMERLDNLHIVIITRDTTIFDFTELLSKGLCYIISQQKIKFTEEEVYEYCKRMIPSISGTEIKSIYSYSDGWISLVYLLLLGLDNGIPVGMNENINELVEKMLFNTYEDNIRDFLLKLSIMDIFSAKQALFVTQVEKAEDILKELQKKNAFVYYDQSSQTYKIHNVLLDFLRMKQHFNTKERSTLYSRLGGWHLAENNFLAAYSCYNLAGDIEKILSHLNRPENIRNELTGFEGSFDMFRKIPRKLLYQYPVAYLQHILLCIVKGDENTIIDCARQLDELKKAYESIENIDEDYRNHIIAEILIFKRFTTFNRIDPSDETNKEIMRLLNGQMSYIMSRENEFTMGSPHLLYVYFRDKGSFRQISQLAIERFRTYANFANGCGTGSEYLIPAEYALEIGDWKSAELNSLRSIYKARTTNQLSIIICANFTLIRLYLLQGKVSEVFNTLTQLEEDVSLVNNPIYNTTLDMVKGYVYACLGQRERIPLWLQTGNMSTADLLYQGVAFNYIIFGKSVLLSKNYIALEVLTETLVEKFDSFSNQLGFIHNHIFRAIAKLHVEGMEAGTTALEYALKEAQADGIVMPFVENAPHIMSMLKAVLNKNLNNEYIQIILFYSEQFIESLENSKLANITLTQREIEVLSLLADGLKREEIAERLCLSHGTVRTHIQNIFKKLKVSGKVSAIKTAQLNGLI
jgi:ATP-dependent transcriptional regulator